MYFVGIDLAWGERSPTGLAVADSRGALVHLAAATTDADIVAQLARMRRRRACWRSTLRWW